MDINPASTILKDALGAYVKGKFIIINPDYKYSVNAVNQTQINSYNNGDVPGIQAEVELDTNTGTPNETFSYSFNLDSELTINDTDKPFLDIIIKVWDPIANEYVRKAGVIVRTVDCHDV